MKAVRLLGRNLRRQAGLTRFSATAMRACSGQSSTTSPTTTMEMDSEEKSEVSEMFEQATRAPRPTYQTKTPMELIAEVPPIEIDATVAECDGMYFNEDMTVREDDWLHAKVGHPRQYIQLNTRVPYTPVTCKYCGLRWVMKRPEGEE